MSVTTEHPDYAKMKKEWLTVSALASGTREVKSKPIVKEILPNPDPNDGERYDEYIRRAIYTNYTGRTRTGMVGAAFRNDPVIDLPTGLDYLEDDATGGGLSLIQLAKDVLGDLMVRGREILLVDYPPATDDLTAEQTKELKATIKRYSPLSLINWGPDFLVFEEMYNVSEDEFGHEQEVQHRVCRVREGVYTQQIYRDEKPFTEEMPILDGNGSTFDFIPCVAVGAQNNDLDVDEIPLADIAHVNAGHFRNSADLEENSFIHSQLTLGITTDLDEKAWSAANPNGVTVGSRTGIYLGTTGGFHTVQADPNNLAGKLMEDKQGQMIALGARIIEKRGPDATATQARIDAHGENSVLSDLVSNVESAINDCIKWCGLFMNEPTTGDEFEMNREFFDSSVDPQTAVMAIQYYDRGLITQDDAIYTARKAGIVSEDTTDEDIKNNVVDPINITNNSNATWSDDV